MTSGIQQDPAVPLLAVVIPARNEEQRLPRCLRSVLAANDVLRCNVSGAPATRIVVVLDGCTDGSRAIVAGFPGVEAIVRDLGNVGAARAAGVEYLQGSTSRVPDWICCTDADSAVPMNWLVEHLRHARADTDLLLGVVRPDAGELQPSSLNRWMSQYHLQDGHPHVHGANMGIRMEMYQRAGGFPPLVEHEDVALTRRVRALGGRVVSSAGSPVSTSARIDGRTPGGMAGYLRAMISATVVD